MWQDGSRFLIASGVKWGTGPKVYKGASHDTEWNKDLLWRLHVEHEAKKFGPSLPKGPDDVEAMPPLMKSLAAVLHDSSNPVPLYQPYRNDPAKTGQVFSERLSRVEEIKRSKYLPHLTAQKRREAEMAGFESAPAPTGRATPSSLKGSASAGALPQLSPGGSARQQLATSSTTARLRRLEEALDRERSERMNLSRTLEDERHEREALQQQLERVKSELSHSDTARAKLAQYQEIMGNLKKASEKAARKK